MMGLRTCALLILAIALLSFSGCLALEGGNQIPLPDRLSGKDITVNRYIGPADSPCYDDYTGNLPCKAMVCRNTTSWLGAILNYETKLDGGNCTFKFCIPINNSPDSCFQQQSSSWVSEKNWWNRVFMLGSGATFASTDRANRLCNYSLQLATKWMNGNATELPEIPDERQVARAKCWLERNTLPIYIYNTNGSAIDMPRSIAISKAFGEADHGTGPAILVSDPFFNSSDNSAVQDVTNQLYAFKANCEKCLVAFGVKSGDYDALSAVLGDPANPKPVSQIVDMVGFGFRNTDYDNCSSDQILYENFRYSRTILKNYSLPTIWLYVGASENYSRNGYCNWTAASVHDFYISLFTNVQSFASSGIVGMSLYEFSDGTGPIPCNGVQGCSFGITYANGSQKLPEMNTWARACKFLANDSFRSPLVFSRNGQTTCGIIQTRDILNMDSKMQFAPAQEFAWPYNSVSPACGEICPSDTDMEKPEIYDEAVDGNGNPFTFNEQHCTLYPAVDEWAEKNGVSGIYMRSIFEQESGYDPLIVSCINSSSTNCNPNNYNITKICEMAGMTGCHTLGNAPECDAGYKPCAYGIAQCIEYPTQGPSDCGGSSYNPFDPGQSACCGASKFKSFLDGARNFVSMSWPVLSSCDGGMEQSEQGWAEYYLASNKYYGSPNYGMDTFGDFMTQLNANGQCSGEPHYISYLRNLTGDPPYANYSAQVMTRYLDAVENKCQTDCPGT